MSTETRNSLAPGHHLIAPLPRPSTVMIVDDEPRAGLLFEKIFAEEGYQVTSVTSGALALALVATAPPDIILLDLVMPDLDGMATLRELRRRRYMGPVILLTAQGTVETAREAMALGAYDYITKPFRLDFLKAVLREGLRSLPEEGEEEKDDACAH
jgi:DNA-binding response OmpR family regulator